MPRKQPFLLIALLLLLAGCKQTKQLTVQPAPVDQSVQTNPVFLFLSDIHLDASAGNISYGSDTGMDLWKQFLAKAGAILSGSNAPKFILYTGDLPSHNNCESPCKLEPGSAAAAANNKNIATILTGLRTLADTYNKPLFYLPGNNDGLTGDYYSFSDSSQHTPFSLVPDPRNPYPALNMSATGKVPGIIASNKAMGYYSARPMEGLRLICLNTVIYTPKFTAADGSSKSKDREDQMKWLSAQLSQAAGMKEKVYIAMHVPPGTDAYSGKPMWDTQPVSWLPYFLSLTAKYQSTIAGIFYGHTHMDELRRLYDTSGKKVTEIALSCPGVSPLFGNNPGFKTVSYDAQSKEVMDFTTYYSTPAAPGWGGTTYSFDSIFGGSPGKTIYERMKNVPLPALGKTISGIYTVMNGTGAESTVVKGIEVK